MIAASVQWADQMNVTQPGLISLRERPTDSAFHMFDIEQRSRAARVIN